MLLAEEADLLGTNAALAAGVQAILLGDATGAEIAAAAYSAAAGLLTLSGDLADLVRQSLLAHAREEADESEGRPDPNPDASPEHLTPREREVLEMMMEGLSNKEIAAATQHLIAYGEVPHQLHPGQAGGVHPHGGGCDWSTPRTDHHLEPAAGLILGSFSRTRRGLAAQHCLAL